MTCLTPKIDIAFKRIFGVEENKDLLISFINSVVSEKDQVTDLEIMNPYNPQNFAREKWSTLDVRAKAKRGGLFNIKIHMAYDGYHDQKALFHWAELYAGPLDSREADQPLRKSIGIHLLNFHTMSDDSRYHHCFYVVDSETKERCLHDMEMHIIELHTFESPIKELFLIMVTVICHVDFNIE